jgi:hypothetical protein
MLEDVRGFRERASAEDFKQHADDDVPNENFSLLMSIPVWREAHRAETTVIFQASQVFPYEAMKLRPTCHCYSAISPHDIRFQRKIYGGLGHAINRSVYSVECRFSCYPYSIIITICFRYLESWYDNLVQKKYPSDLVLRSSK